MLERLLHSDFFIEHILLLAIFATSHDVFFGSFQSRFSHNKSSGSQQFINSFHLKSSCYGEE